MNRSEEWAARLRRVIPWGSSTCSKSARLMPDEPGVIVRGEGCRVWDADGREFIDYRNGLGPVTLGYGFPAVNEAVAEQLTKGIIFGHPHPLECEVAEMLCEVIPCAERARFLKTGGEAVAACIRLARCFTGRDHIVQIGYNGWLNGLAGGGHTLPGATATATPPGVPAALSALHHAFEWGDCDAIEQRFKTDGDKIAAVVVAASYPRMAEGKTFYPFLRSVTALHGALLVFDEIVTGFRVAVGGVQEFFGVTPDLAVFAKGIANGMPLSVYCGAAKVMEKLNDAIVSSTYGGETLSLAAAKATLLTYRSNDVVGHIWRQGEMLQRGLNRILGKHRLPAEYRGLPPCPSLATAPGAPEDFFDRYHRAAYSRGVSFYRVNYCNFSHQDADIEETLARVDRAAEIVRSATGGK